MVEALRLLMQLTAGAFAGACLYILFVQHPVRMTLGAPAALHDFRETIPRAERLQAPLLVVSLVAGALTLVLRFRWPTAIGVVLLLAVLVQTVATVLPINRRLLSGDAADHLPGAAAALGRWGRLHALRTLVAVVGAGVLLAG